VIVSPNGNLNASDCDKNVGSTFCITWVVAFPVNREKHIVNNNAKKTQNTDSESYAYEQNRP
jgi:hypothetical protein